MANNFTGDSNAKALYSLESGALGTDSLNAVNMTNSGVTANTSTYKEKAASGSFVAASSQHMYLANSSLPSGFPWKSDDTNKSGSILSWVYMNSLPAGANTIFGKYNSVTADERSIVMQVRNFSGSGKATMVLGYNSGTQAEVVPEHATALSLSTWYHITWTYNNADKSYGIYIRDINGNTVGVDKTGTATLDANKLSVTTGSMTIGCFYVSGAPFTNYIMDGLLDETVIFRDIITPAEATQIAQGVYGLKYSGYLGDIKLGHNILGNRGLSK